MSGTLSTLPSAPAKPLQPKRFRPFTSLFFGVLLVYLAAAYLVAPAAWKRYARRHPTLEDVPGITHTGSGIHGDPINVALIGTESELGRAMLAANWDPADPLTLRSCLKIAAATVFKRSYDEAPVSSLYLFGRKEDLAFEKSVNDNPRKRHHVRFWRAPKDDPDGRPVWVGASIYDDRVGISRTTGQITHHTGADVDAERDLVINDLKAAGALAETYVIPGFHKVCQGRNGGGDPWHTDGDLWVGVLKPFAPEPVTGHR
jgi:hypothetical protein